MRNFSDLVREIREYSGLSQRDFADKLEVSSIYISKIETEQKEVSKKFVLKLSEFTGVHPSALAPFLYLNSDINPENLSKLERKLIILGEKLQNQMLKRRISKNDEATN